ncbi:MAG: hypothetical protein AB1486_30505 [Planctomycetota bacterium]
MDEETTIKSTIQLNVLAASIFFVGLVLLAQLIINLTRRAPEAGGAGERPALAVVGFRDSIGGDNYDSFTIFENDGEVYIYWREGDTWRSRPLPHYK